MVLALDEHDATIYTGDTLKLCANISPDSATNKGLLWTSSNPDIAAVDANGNVRGLSVGSAEILCTAADGSEVTDKCAVTVRAKVKGVTLDQSRLELVIGNGEEAATGRIDFTLQPENAYIQTVTWTSSTRALLRWIPLAPFAQSAKESQQFLLLLMIQTAMRLPVVKLLSAKQFPPFSSLTPCQL